MNASVGDAGEISSSGVNTNNPGYAQFFRLTSMPAPARIFVFLDEHPDSISDGYFVNRIYYPEWMRLPGFLAQCGGHFFLRRRAHGDAPLEMRQHHAAAGARRRRTAH